MTPARVLQFISQGVIDEANAEFLAAQQRLHAELTILHEEFLSLDLSLRSHIQDGGTVWIVQLVSEEDLVLSIGLSMAKYSTGLHPIVYMRMSWQAGGKSYSQEQFDDAFVALREGLRVYPILRDMRRKTVNYGGVA